MRNDTRESGGRQNKARLIKNLERPWMRQYNFSAIKRINRLRKKTKSRNYFIKRVRHLPEC